MSPETTLIQLRHDGDLLSVLRADGPWARPAAGAAGLLNAVLAELVSRRDLFPVQLTDRAFATVDELARDIAAARGCDEHDVSVALRQLKAARLVESCGVAVGRARWRATQQAMLTVRTFQHAA